MVYFLCKAYDSDRQNCYFAQSLPVRGAWIEIVCSCRALYPRHGRSPCGERGLKLNDATGQDTAALESLPVRGAWIEMAVTNCYGAERDVAPRAGSVD